MCVCVDDDKKIKHRLSAHLGLARGTRDLVLFVLKLLVVQHLGHSFQQILFGLQLLDKLPIVQGVG